MGITIRKLVGEFPQSISGITQREKLMMFQMKVFYSLFSHLFKLACGIRLLTSQTLLLSVKLAGRNKRKGK